MYFYNTISDSHYIVYQLIALSLTVRRRTLDTRTTDHQLKVINTDLNVNNIYEHRHTERRMQITLRNIF